MKKEFLKHLFSMLEFNENMVSRIKAQDFDALPAYEADKIIAVRESRLELHSDNVQELNKLIDLYIQHHGTQR